MPTMLDNALVLVPGDVPWKCADDSCGAQYVSVIDAATHVNECHRPGGYFYEMQVQYETERIGTYTHAEFDEAMESIAAGTSSALITCDQCSSCKCRGIDEAPGCTHLGPLRGWVKSGVTPGFDPSVYYTLTCGHTVL